MNTIKRKPTAKRMSVLLTVVGVLASVLTVVSSGTASADDLFPELQYSAVAASGYTNSAVASPTGDVTLNCSNGGTGNRDLVTYSSSGAIVHQVPLATSCVQWPVVDQNGDVYGVPVRHVSSGPENPNTLIAYHGATLKWTYSTSCSTTSPAPVAVGADGNIYTVSKVGSDVHLIGLTPDVAPGQTVPTKVLDVSPIPSAFGALCSGRVIPYKDGIVVLAAGSMAPRYYSYGGKFLGEIAGVTGGSSAVGESDSVNADGRLFRWTQSSGLATDVAVTAYNPGNGVPAWTTTASTPGANAKYVNAQPLPGGGLEMLVQEKKMGLGGIPASPAELVYTLVTLDSNGFKVRAVQLPNTDASGNKYLAPVIRTDTTGHIVMVRELTVTGTTRRQIAISNIDVAAGTITPVGVMGDDNTSYQQTSYGKLYYVGGGPVIGPNTLYINATCTGTCTAGAMLYTVKIPGLGMDYPRGDVITANTPAQPTPKHYVAMGDSYSSGQGAKDYDGTTVTTSNTCYRSANAYAQVLNRDPNSSLHLDTFPACGGAETPVITNQWPSPFNQNEPPQDQALSSATDVVTLTIGGNDIGFASVLQACFLNPLCDVDDALSKISAIGPTLQDTYRHILTKAGNAEVYVIGYPPIVVDDDNELCLSVSQIGYPAILQSKTKMRSVLDALNDEISSAVSDVHADEPRIHFVKADGPESPFNGHDVCSSEPYFNGLLALPAEYPGSFHPNAKGQKAFAKLVSDAMGE